MSENPKMVEAQPGSYPKDVHTEHCCAKHGCKYGQTECSVATGQKPQSFPCEDCQWEAKRRPELAEVEKLRAERDANAQSAWNLKCLLVACMNAGYRFLVDQSETFAEALQLAVNDGERHLGQELSPPRFVSDQAARELRSVLKAYADWYGSIGGDEQSLYANALDKAIASARALLHLDQPAEKQESAYGIPSKPLPAVGETVETTGNAGNFDSPSRRVVHEHVGRYFNCEPDGPLYQDTLEGVWWRRVPAQKPGEPVAVGELLELTGTAYKFTGTNRYQVREIMTANGVHGFTCWGTSLFYAFTEEGKWWRKAQTPSDAKGAE